MMLIDDSIKPGFINVVDVDALWGLKFILFSRIIKINLFLKDFQSKILIYTPFFHSNRMI